MHSLGQFQRFFPRYGQEQSKTYSQYIPFKNFVKDEDDFKLSSFHNHYTTPTSKDMLVILPFFNPCNSIRILQNMLFVKHKLEQANIPFVVIHCIFPNNHSLGNETDKYMIVRTNSYAFLKENLANIVIQKHVDDYDKFIIHDCDILFGEHDWYDNVSNELDNVDIVQPYETFKNMDSNFLDVTGKGSSLFKVHHHGSQDGKQGHPGYLIAFTKSFWISHGYPDETLIGGGDTLICSIALRMKLFENHHNSLHMDHLYNKYHNDKEIKTSFVKGTIYHMYHNESKNRQYTTRYLILNKYINEDTPYNCINDIIKKNDDGVYEWIDEIRDEINNDILSYFASRRDDEVPVV